jgi:hypothetical protein
MLRPDQYHGAATQASAGDLSTDDPLCKGRAVDDPVDRLGPTSVPSGDVYEICLGKRQPVNKRLIGSDPESSLFVARGECPPPIAVVANAHVVADSREVASLQKS